MDSGQSDARAIVLKASEMKGEVRAAFLEEACAGDPSLRAQVERLLDAETLTAIEDMQPAAAANLLTAGETIAGRFRIVRFLGRGGMGEVYQAEDLELGGQVALKTLRANLLHDPRFLGRFRREVHLARQVTHPNVCRIFDVGRDQTGRDLAFLTMEFLEGDTLAQRLRRDGPLPCNAALPLLQQIAAGLDALHDKGIVHRDFKPANIMLVEAYGCQPRVAITDFGLARAVIGSGDDEILSQPGHLMGTPDFMAPEQLLGNPVTPAADIYAFGLVMYEMMTGRKAFLENGVLGQAAQRIVGKPIQPREHVADLPEHWEAAILACLATDPRQRPATAGAAVGGIAGDIGIASAPAKAPARLARFWPAAAAASAILIFAAFPEVRHRIWSVGDKSIKGVHDDYLTATSLLDHYYKSSNLKAATDILQKLVRDQPDSALGHAGLCRAYWNAYANERDTNLIDTAQRACLKSIELDAELAPPRVTLASIYAETGRHDQASQELQKAIRLDARNAAAYGALAVLYRKQGRDVDVEPTLQKAVDLDPEDWRWRNLLGLYYRDLGQLDAAAVQLEKSRELTPGNAIAANNLGNVYLRQNRFAEARKAYEASIVLEPSYRSFSNLGLVLQLEGKFEESATAFHRALELNPESYVAWANLAASLEWGPGGKAAARAAYEKAISLCEKQRSQTPKDARLISDLGAYHAAVGNRDRSLMLTRQALALAPLDSNVRRRAAETYRLAEERKAAIAHLKKAIELGYPFEHVKRNPELSVLVSDREFSLAAQSKMR